MSKDKPETPKPPKTTVSHETLSSDVPSPKSNSNNYESRDN